MAFKLFIEHHDMSLQCTKTLPFKFDITLAKIVTYTVFRDFGVEYATEQM